MGKLLSPLWLSTTARLSLHSFSIPNSLLYGIQDAPGHTSDVGGVWRLHLDRKKIFHPLYLHLLSCHFLYNCCNMDLVLGQWTIVCCKNVQSNLFISFWFTVTWTSFQISFVHPLLLKQLAKKSEETQFFLKYYFLLRMVSLNL